MTQINSWDKDPLESETLDETRYGLDKSGCTLSDPVAREMLQALHQAV